MFSGIKKVFAQNAHIDAYVLRVSNASQIMLNNTPSVKVKDLIIAISGICLGILQVPYLSAGTYLSAHYDTAGHEHVTQCISLVHADALCTVLQGTSKVYDVIWLLVLLNCMVAAHRSLGVK